MEEVSLYKYLKQCPAIDFKNLSIVIIITITAAVVGGVTKGESTGGSQGDEHCSQEGPNQASAPS